MAILKTHYDPSYARSTASRPLTDILALTATRLDEDDIIRLASELTAQGSWNTRMSYPIMFIGFIFKPADKILVEN